MKRNIKYRGRTIPEREWKYGLPMYDPIDDFWYIFEFEEDKQRYVSHIVDPDTIGQSTGLRDRNGVEIYEGDIIVNDLHDQSEFEVAYRGDRFVAIFKCDEIPHQLHFGLLKEQCVMDKDKFYIDCEVIR